VGSLNAEQQRRLRSLEQAMEGLRDRVPPGDDAQTGRDTLTLALEITARREATIAFVGHFSSGKSSVLNALMKREVLPVKDLQETGTICRLRSGAVDRAIVMRADRKGEEIPCTREAIKAHVSLREPSGIRANPKLDDVKTLDITLASAPIPEGSVWIDSPGTDDTAAMALKADEAARSADLLVWVLTSKQFLSVTEQELLSAHLSSGGRLSMTLLLNAFLRQDTDESWQEFLREALPVHRSKLGDCATAMGIAAGELPEMIVGSARAISSGLDFGRTELMRFLEDHGTLGSSRVASSRLRRIAAMLDDVDATMADIMRKLQNREAQMASEEAEQAAALQRSTASFLDDVDEALRRYIADWTNAAMKEGEALGSSILKGALDRRVDYGAVLTQALATANDDCLETLARRIRLADSRWNVGIATGRLTDQIKAHLQFEPIRLAARNGDLKGGGIAAKMAAGAVVGSFIPVVGTITGALIGGMYGFARESSRSGNEDRQGTAADIRQAAAHAATTVQTGQVGTILREALATKHARPTSTELEECRLELRGHSAFVARLNVVRAECAALGKLIEESCQ